MDLNLLKPAACSAKLIALDETYLEQMLQLQKEVVTALPDPQLFVASSKEDFEAALKENTVIGIVTCSHQLIALGIYLETGNTPCNYGWDLGLTEAALEEVGQIDTTLVAPLYRGNGLQKILCETLEQISRVQGKSLITATVSPYNSYSLNTFLKLGYEIKKDLLKYGGLRRYIVAKTI